MNLRRKLVLSGIGLPSLALLSSYYYLEKTSDTVYIPGGLNRGIRCFWTASKVIFKYLYVSKALIRTVSIQPRMIIQPGL